MTFHLRTEIPEPVSRDLDESLPDLTQEEVRILKSQILHNSGHIQADIKRLELFILREKYPKNEKFILKIRENLHLSMAENDTFRKVLWKHYRSSESVRRPPKISP